MSSSPYCVPWRLIRAKRWEKCVVLHFEGPCQQLVGVWWPALPPWPSPARCGMGGSQDRPWQRPPSIFGSCPGAPALSAGHGAPPPEHLSHPGTHLITATTVSPGHRQAGGPRAQPHLALWGVVGPCPPRRGEEATVPLAHGPHQPLMLLEQFFFSSLSLYLVYYLAQVKKHGIAQQ